MAAPLIIVHANGHRGGRNADLDLYLLANPVKECRYECPEFRNL